MAHIADRRRLALVTTLLLAALALSLVVMASDLPVRDHRSLDSGHARAAVALRDDVIPFQKWGTKLFTLPHLESAYDEVFYLTAAAPGEKHDELVAALTRALRKYDQVDLFLLAHANHFIYWVSEVPPALREKLRLVYNTGCADAYQGRQWLAIGAQAYVGHPARRSLSPVFYFYFLRRWVHGVSLDDAVDAANRAAHRRVSWLGLDGTQDDPRAVLFGRSELWVGSGANEVR